MNALSTLHRRSFSRKGLYTLCMRQRLSGKNGSIHDSVSHPFTGSYIQLSKACDRWYMNHVILPIESLNFSPLRERFSPIRGEFSTTLLSFPVNEIIMEPFGFLKLFALLNQLFYLSFHPPFFLGHQSIFFFFRQNGADSVSTYLRSG